MLNLLKVELKTLIKFKPTQWMLVLYPILAVLFTFMMNLNESAPLTALINGMFLVNIITVSVGGLFLYTDYSQNTIRNKIVVGHTRLSVYTAKFAVIFLFYLACILLYAVPSFIIDCFVSDMKDVVWEAIWKNMLIVFCNMIINVAIIVFFTTVMRSIIGAIMPFCAAEFLAVGGTLWLEILSVDNPDLFEIVQAVPCIKAMMLSAEIVPTDVGMSCAITAGMVVSLLLSGYLSFRRADLN